MSNDLLFTYKLTLAYDGKVYCGWQRQPNALSIQEVLEQALKTYLKEEIRVVGAGRTDAGVHAKGQVAHFRIGRTLDVCQLKRALNGILPLTVRIVSAETCSSSFHAQKSALSKEYHYHIALGDVVLPFYQPYVWFVRKKLDIPLLKSASKLFIGKHNFSAFANSQDCGAAGKNPFRTIFRLDTKETEYGICLEFEGDGFLYKMVRNITGMLVAVASGARQADDITMLLLGAPRYAAARAAPAQGLFFIRATYPQRDDHTLHGESQR